MVRRKKKKQPLKINYLLIFIVLVCLVYEPIRQTVYENTEKNKVAHSIRPKNKIQKKRPRRSMLPMEQNWKYRLN